LSIQLIKQYTEMRQMMRQLSGSRAFWRQCLKGKIVRRMAGMSVSPISAWMTAMVASRRLGHPKETEEETKKKRR